MDEHNQPTPAEPTDATTEAEAPVQDAPVEAAAVEAPQAPVYDWRKALEEAPADEIRRHPKFAGILGSEKPRWMEEWASTKQAEADAKAKVEAERALEEMAEQRPVEFADKWLGDRQTQKMREQVANLEQTARQTTATAIGAAMHTIPEWESAATDPDVLARLAQAMQGKQGDEVLSAWNATAITIVAERRAAALFEKQVAERIKAERAAWETEAAAQGFKLSARPDLVRAGRHPNGADPEPDYLRDAKAWDAWYKRNT